MKNLNNKGIEQFLMTPAQCRFYAMRNKARIVSEQWNLIDCT